jgi:hypothetical protein
LSSCAGLSRLWGDSPPKTFGDFSNAGYSPRNQVPWVDVDVG